MCLVAETVFKVFKPKKLNYELLGNKDSHLHWHIIPRYSYDSHPQWAIWAIDQSVVNSDKYCPSKADLKKMRGKFIKALKTLQ